MKNKGFTLIEVIAVLIVLAIVGLIVTPLVTNLIKSSKDNADLRSAEGYIEAAKIFYAEATDEDKVIAYSNMLNYLDVNGTKADSGVVKADKDGQIYLSVIINNKCYIKDYVDTELSIDEDIEKCNIYTPERYFTYTLDENNEATITGFSGGGTGVIYEEVPEGDFRKYTLTSNNDGEYKEVYIPPTIGGYNVVAIGEKAFYDIWIDSVVIPEGVTTIGINAFARNGISRVVLPSTLKTIGQWAFECTNISQIRIPNGVTSIGLWAFANSQLTSVVIPDSVTEMREGVFYNNKIISAVLPNNMPLISNGLFLGNKLTSIIIPDGVTDIGDHAFANNELINVTISDSVITIDEYAFLNNNLTSVNIPNNVVSIGEESFYNNPDLKYITIDNAEGIVSYAPWGATNAEIAYLR